MQNNFLINIQALTSSWMMFDEFISYRGLLSHQEIITCLSTLLHENAMYGNTHECFISVCVSQEDEPVQMVHWDGLLLLAGLLHWADPTVKQRLVQERGNLLLQLLHTVLMKDEKLGGKGVPA